MSFTERKRRGTSTHYYRVRSYREDGKVKKRRKYLGKDLDKLELTRLEDEADQELNILLGLLPEAEIKELEIIRSRHALQPKETWKNRYEAFVSRFTHDSTAIEGNTLTLQETTALLFERIAPSSKEMREISEVINHREAFDQILSYEEYISRELILKLHTLVMKGTLGGNLESQLGRYRMVQVFIRGVEWIPPAPEDVPLDMKELLSWYTRNKNKLHPLVLASYFHIGFETIHPFVDGNGRVGRLLLNLILHRYGFPRVNIPNRRKLEYYYCLSKAQNDGDLRPFIELMLDLMRSTDLQL